MVYVHVSARLAFRARVWPHLGEEDAELLKGLEQTSILDLLDDKDTFRWFVPGESLAGRVLNVPEHTNTKLQQDNEECVRGRTKKGFLFHG